MTDPDDTAPTFTDTRGYEWSLRLTDTIVSRVRQRTGIILGTLARHEAALFAFLAGNAGKADQADALFWTLVESQAITDRVSQAEFRTRLTVEVRQNLLAALLPLIAAAVVAPTPFSFRLRRAPGTVMAELLTRIADQRQRRRAAGG